MRRCQFEDHAEGFATFGQTCSERLFVETIGLAKFHTNEETARKPIIEGMVFGDVAALLEQKAGHRVHGAEDARAVGGQNPCVWGAAHSAVTPATICAQRAFCDDQAWTLRPYSAAASCNHNHQ